MKSEIVYIGGGERNVRVHDVSLGEQSKKQVEDFAYLGSVVASKGKLTIDIER